MPIAFPPIPEDQFELYADLYAKPGRGDELEKHLRILVRLTESEPGTLEYAIARNEQDPNHFHVFERYTGRQAFEAHCAAKEFVDFVESGALAQEPQPKFLKQLKPM